MTLAVEFSRGVNVARLPHAGTVLAIEASLEERAALARRFDLPAIARLRADLQISPIGEGRIRLAGRLEAEVTQVSVVSLDPFVQRIEAPLDIILVPRAQFAADAGATIDPAAPDEEAYDGGSFDAGEIVAQSLALALDPWPRNPGIDPPPGGGGSDVEPPASPFAVLGRRRQ